jgi:ABC-type amino acid transport substrate-binding protein
MGTKLSLVAAAALALAAGFANASTFTDTSPAGGTVPSGVSTIGGVVLDLTGTNGTRVVSQLAASTLYVGYANADPFTVGTQSGFTPSVLAALGGGLASASVRFTLYDGDSAVGDFDENNLTLLVNGVDFGNWSNVSSQTTDALGVASGPTHAGFRDEQLDTGWFSTTSATTLASFYSTLSGGSVQYQVKDVDPFDNYYDFTQGINSSLINVGTGPVVTPAIPEPQTYALMVACLGVLAVVTRRKSSK